MKIICYGDSNTYGFDPRLGSPGRLAKNERWTGILDSEPDIEIENEGMNGRCIPSASYEYRSLKKILERHYDADMLIIMLGSNDLFMTRGATAEKIADKMRNVFVNVPHQSLKGNFQEGTIRFALKTGMTTCGFLQSFISASDFST